jgi:signal peptidase I
VTANAVRASIGPRGAAGRAESMTAGTRSTLREYIEAALWALVVTLFLRAFVIQAYRIPSESMMNTLLVGDYLFVNKFEYGPKLPFTHFRFPGLRQPRRGDVIVFQFPRDPSVDFVKRCVSTGGETVEIHDKQLWIDGRALDEPYVIHTDPAVRPGGFEYRDNFGPFSVPAGKMFMMGDNRDNSEDSRYWGPLEMDLVKGHAMFLYWSWDLEHHAPRWSRIFQAIR